MIDVGGAAEYDEIAVSCVEHQPMESVARLFEKACGYGESSFRGVSNGDAMSVAECPEVRRRGAG